MSKENDLTVSEFKDLSENTEGSEDAGIVEGEEAIVSNIVSETNTDECSCEDGDEEMKDKDDELEEAYYDKDGKKMSKMNAMKMEYFYDKEGNKVKNESYVVIESSEVNFEVLAETLGVSSDNVSELKEMFEGIVTLRVNEERAIFETALQAASDVALAEAKELFEAETLEKVEAYSAQVVKEWVEENEVKIADLAEATRNAAIVEGFKNLFESNNVILDESQVDVVAELTAEKDELSEKLDIEIQRSDKLEGIVEAVARTEEVRKYELDEAMEAKVLAIVEGYEINEKFESRVEAVVDLIKSAVKPIQESAPKSEATDQFIDSFVETPKAVNENQTKGVDFNSWLKETI